MEARRVRQELETWYAENRDAFQVEDLAAIMALRTSDLHAITPDGSVHSRSEMEQATRALLDAVDRWIEQSVDIDSLVVSDGEARAVVRQHLVRMARRSDGLIHHVETWVTQREVFRCTPEGWKLHQVDGIRDQRRLVDGQPG
jgi:ketosteroid isomerase-like protein